MAVWFHLILTPKTEGVVNFKLRAPYPREKPVFMEQEAGWYPTLVHAIKSYGEVEVYFNSFLHLALEEGEC